jgi:septal ring factor EnvC (AmiA/AmiB activator)
MRETSCLLITCLALAATHAPLHAQSAPSPHAATSSPTTADAQSIELQKKLEAISSDLATTHQQLDQSKQEIEQLREELVLIKKQLASSQPGLSQPSIPANEADTAKTTASAIEDLQEQQQTLEAQVKLHEQTKVESESKYPVRVTGLILFNSFINRGIVDNIDLPEAALAPSDDCERPPSHQAMTLATEVVVQLSVRPF